MEALQRLQEISLVSSLCKELDNHNVSNSKLIAEWLISLEKEHKYNGEQLYDFLQTKDSEKKFQSELCERIVNMVSRALSIKIAKSKPSESSIKTFQIHKISVPSSADGPLGAAGEPNAESRSRSRSQSRSHRRRHRRHSSSSSPSSSSSSSSRGHRKHNRHGSHRRHAHHSRHHHSPHRSSADPRPSSQLPSATVEERRERSPPATPHAYRTLEPFQIYKGIVTGVMDFGCFVQLVELERKTDGLVHISQISNSRPQHPGEYVKKGQEVLVKVLEIVGNRISLSMKEVDQDTGEDLLPNRRNSRIDPEHQQEPMAPITKVNSASSLSQKPFKKNKRQLTDYELFELKQLVSSGQLPIQMLPDYDDEEGTLNVESNQDVEVDYDVELNDKTPKFLSGQEKKIGELSPIRIVRNPDGTLQRAATTQSALSRERKILREQQRAQREGRDPKDVLPDDPAASQLEEDTEDSRDSHFYDDWKRMVNQRMRPTAHRQVNLGEQRKSLPVYKLKDAFLKAVQDHPVLVVKGETGSGKTTQMTQYLVEAGYSKFGSIGCTQPRRVAAMSVAKRVAEEMGCRLGQEVGYCVRFDDCSSRDTVIKYMTDGMLMREYLMDSLLKRYSVIILDEAHERTVNTDVLFSLLKKLSKKRPELKVIITSATLDAEKYALFYDKCPVFQIPGRCFDVEYLESPAEDYVESSMDTVLQIHFNEPKGDILLFLTGREEIDTVCETLSRRMHDLQKHQQVPELIVIPVYAALPPDLQNMIFEPTPPGKRKCVVATNIAEASITIDGIYYVVDPGFCKQKAFNPKTGMDALIPVPISQASAKQRMGRAGRTGPGKCYRLYTKNAYENEMLPNTIPEIQRANLGTIALQLKAMGINDVVGFEFMDPPPLQTLISAMHHLWELEALDDDGLLTRLGRKMAQFPLDPTLSKVLIKSSEFGCSEEILTIVSILSVENIFFRPRDKQEEADSRHKQFYQSEGDHFTLLCVYENWVKNGRSSTWCTRNFLMDRNLKKCEDTRKQLLGIMDQYKLDILSCHNDHEKIQKCLVSGYFGNVARRNSSHDGYERLIDSAPVYIHPSSSLAQRAPEWVIYHEVTVTSREYMRHVMQIIPKWLVELASNFYRPTDPKNNPKNQKLDPLHDRFHAKDAWRLSRRRG